MNHKEGSHKEGSHKEAQEAQKAQEGYTQVQGFVLSFILSCVSCASLWLKIERVVDL
jgi:hypothetical protein